MKNPTGKKKQQPRLTPATPAKAIPAAGSRISATYASHPWLPWLGLALLAIAAFLPALKAGYVWDDDALTANPYLRSMDGLLKIWTDPKQIPREMHYWPLVYTTFWLEYRLWGLHPFGYHLVNILLHAATTVLLWRVLRRLSVPGAWFGAALFAVHPIHAESVAWVIERKDVLSGALFFAAALAYLRFDRGFRNSEIQNSEDRKQNQIPPEDGTLELAARHSRLATAGKWYVLTLVLFLAALLSKSVVIGLPLALAFALWWRHSRLGWRDAAALAPLALMAVVMTLMDMKLWAGTEFVEPAAPYPARLLQASRAAWTYLVKLAIPYPLATFYPRWDISPSNPLAWAPLLAGLALLIWLWAARRRIGRGPLAAALYYGVLLGPTLGLVHYDFLHFSWVADRFQYLASAGPLALAAAALVHLSQRQRWSREAARFGAGALVGLLCLLCMRQSSLYENSLKLFQHNVKAYPKTWASHYMYGWALMEAGRVQEAVASLGEALRLTPSPDYMSHFFMAQAQARAGNAPEADFYFRKSIALNPKFASGYNNYGVFLTETGRAEEALAQFDLAMKIRPDYPEALGNKGNALNRLGRLEEAERTLRQAIAMDSRRAEFHNNLGMMLVTRNDVEAGVREFETAVQLNPRLPDARINYAMGLAKAGRLDESIAQFTVAIQMQPGKPQLHFHLGEVYRTLNRPREAARCYQEALRLDPGYTDAAQRLQEVGR